MEMKDPVKVERMHKVDKEGSLKAFCDLILYDTFLIKGLRVVEGKNGLFLSMPREQGRDGKWYDTFYPVSKEARKALQNIVLESFNESVAA